MPNYQGVWSLSEQFQAQGQGNWPPNYVLPVGVMFGGAGGSGVNNMIQTLNLTTLGNSVDEGNLSYSPAQGPSAVGNSIVALCAGGQTTASSRATSQYTYATGGDAVDSGDLRVGYGYMEFGGVSSATRGVFAGGFTSSEAIVNTMSYITLGTTGYPADFGDLTVARRNLQASGSSTRGIFGGGKNSSNVQQDTLDYITIATTGNATDFGNLLVATQQMATGSNSTRSIWAGGVSSESTIQYITIASTGNAVDFGDLIAGRKEFMGMSSETRFVFGGGKLSNNTAVTDLEYVEIASTGNALDWGDQAVQSYNFSSTSSAHGGLS
mgnify:FL=1